MPVFEEVNSIQ